MRNNFLNVIINKTKEGNFSWLYEQSKKGICLKFLNKVLPEKIIVGPTMAILLVTYRCNGKCLMCDLSTRFKKTNVKEFNTQKWKEIIDQLDEIKTAGIGFTGGEPLLRNDVAELITYARQKGMSTTLNTNALLFNNENIQKILKSEPGNINISLDGSTSESFDHLRGVKGGYQKIINNTRNLIEERNRLNSKTTITIVTCVSNYNINDLINMAKLAKKLGADKIGFIPLHQISKNTLSCKDNSPNLGKTFLKEIERIRKEKIIPVDNSRQYLNLFPDAFQGKKFPIPCLAGETSITIDSFGNIFGCWPFLELKRVNTNLKERGLSNIWKSKDYKEIRKITTNCRDCFWNCHSELSLFYR